MIDQTAIPVLLSLGLDLLYVVVPIFPVVLIYRMFPNTRVTAEGEISNWKVKAGGAFAAYLVTVLLGYLVADGTKKMISAMVDASWEIRADIDLVDSDGRPVTARDALMNRLYIESMPPVFSHTTQSVLLKMPLPNNLADSLLTFRILDYTEYQTSLDGRSDPVAIDQYERKIKFLKHIVIHLPPRPYAEQQYQEPLLQGNQPAQSEAKNVARANDL